MRGIFVILISIFILPKVQAGFSYVDSVKIFPASATMNDTLKLVAYIICPDSYNFQGHLITVDDTNVIVSSCYFIGDDETEHYVQDTVVLGRFTNGNYKVLYKLREPEGSYLDSSNPCAVFPYTDSTVINFSIHPPNALDATSIKADLQVYPIPTNFYLHIIYPNTTGTMKATVTTTDGQIVTQHVTWQQDRYDLNVSALPAGLYFLSIQSETESWVRKFVKE